MTENCLMELYWRGKIIIIMDLVLSRVIFWTRMGEGNKHLVPCVRTSYT